MIISERIRNEVSNKKSNYLYVIVRILQPKNSFLSADHTQTLNVKINLTL